jgi:hypothetical protein
MSYDVLVEGAIFLGALRTFKGLPRGQHQEDALIFMEGGELVITLAGAAASMPVVGNWVGEVRVAAGFFVTLALKPPTGNRLRLFVKDDRFHVDRLSVACTTQNAWRSEISLPLNADLLTVLKLPFSFPPDRIERAGFASRVAAAKHEAKRLLSQAEKFLKPLQITEAELMQVLTRRLESEAERRCDHARN